MPRAHVIDGRLIVDEPTALPEGTVLDLVANDEGDELDESDRSALQDALARSWTSAQQGKLRPAQQILQELQAKD